MSSFMNNYYYGKAGKADFTEEQLPTTRIQLFFTTLRLHMTGLIGMNLMFVLFALPVLFWTVVNYNVIGQVINTQGATMVNVTGYITTYLLLMIPCLGIQGVGMSGIAFILRNWSRDQHTFTMSDFKDSLKSNWKLGLFEGLWTGVALFVAWYCYLFYGQMSATKSVVFVVPEVLVLIVCAVFLMSTMLAYPMLVTYSLKFRHVVRNSVLITLRRLPMALLVFGLSIAIPFVLLFFLSMNGIAMFVLIVVYLLFGFAFTEFVYISFANSCFDKYLNPLIEGAEVNIGLHQKEEDDDEEEPLDKQASEEQPKE